MNKSSNSYVVTLLVSIIIAVITLSVFEPTLRGKFLMWDDNWCIYQNPTLGGPSFKNLYLIFTNTTVSSSWYTPLTGLTWCIIYQFFKLNPFGYHLVDWLFHAANAVLIFMVLRELLVMGFREQSKAAGAKYRINISAALAALLWSLHPLRAEIVAWAACSYSQALFFMLLSLMAYLRANRPDATILLHRIYMAVSVISFSASMLTQPVGLGFVIVLIVLDIYLLKRLKEGEFCNSNDIRRILFKKMPFIMVGIIIVLINIVIIVYLPRGGHKAVSLAEFGIIDRSMQAMYIWAYYLWRPWFPFKLSPVYSTLVSFKPLSAPFILSAAMVVGLTYFFVLKRRQWPFVLSVWISYLALLAPLLGITDHPYYPNDRYSMLPSICWSVLFAVWFVRFKIRYFSRSFVITVMIIIITFLGLLSFRQTRIWNNNITFFKHILKILGDDPYSQDIHWRFGIVLAEKGDLTRAIKHLKQTLKTKPYHFLTQYYLAASLAGKGEYDEAINHYRQALRNNPYDPYIHYNMAVITTVQGDLSKAVRHYKKALQVKPDWVEPLKNLAWIYATNKKLKNPQDAILLAKKACKLTNYKDPAALDILAAAYAAMGEYLKAIRFSQKALALLAAAGKKDMRENIKRQLKLYKARKPIIKSDSHNIYIK